MDYDAAVDYLVDECTFGFDYEDAERELDFLDDTMDVEAKIEKIKEKYGG